MPNNARPEDALPKQVNCQVCKKEIPQNDAKSSESEDMILYFCGLDCLEHWTGQDRREQGAKP